MKKKLFILMFCFGGVVSKAQVVTQSADGKGSLILPLNGVSLGFDIGKTEISVGANNYSKALDSNNIKAFRNWFFGGNLSVKNSSDIGKFFKSGDIVPAGNVLGFLGFNVNNNLSILVDWNKSKATEIENKEVQLRNQLRKEFGNRILRDAKNLKERITSEELRDEILKRIADSVLTYQNSYRMELSIELIMKDDKIDKDFVKEFTKTYEQRKNEFRESSNKIDETKSINEAFSEFMKTHSVKRFTPFIFGGIDARNFSLYTGLNSSSLVKSFTDTLYRGGQFGIGINGQIGVGGLELHTLMWMETIFPIYPVRNIH
ncbi:MAG: hypothetical protein IPO85_18665 [Saprospiraceae bacterium]|uniref:Uncharacterized protein n=1 Tax=Candidatus Defluviibacterium haderslevense TaxID=2981993 RepID=A0A9D7SDP8_9BACT|nr:hypothetical protein [Candidatus Defluviibacterium haderslevense]